MRRRNPEHTSDSSCKLEVKVAVSFLVSLLKALLVTVDGYNGVGGTDGVHEVGSWSVLVCTGHRCVWQHSGEEMLPRRRGI